VILRIDKLAIELPMPAHPSPNSASAVQELLGGKFGEMSTLMNYTFQSFNFRGRDRMKPFYDLISNIAAEEYGHIELVSHTINMLLSGSTARGDDPSPRHSSPRRTPETSITSLPAAKQPYRSIPWATPGTARTCSPAAI
jgi:Mn-containing catalase